MRLDRVSYLLFFLTAFALRGIPEMLVTPYPVGYETITLYAPIISRFNAKTIGEIFMEIFRSGPTFYMLMWCFSVTSGFAPFLLLKLAAPILYGFLAVVFLVFLRRCLKFGKKAAYVTTFMLIFQPIALRISWDRLRNVLGLTFLFATMTMLSIEHRLKWGLVMFFAVMTALSRDMIALVLFVSMMGFAVLEKKDTWKLIVSLIPAFVWFLLVTYPSNFFLNHLSSSQVSLTSYFGLVSDILLIFAFGYLPILPLVLKGFFRSKFLDSMIVWLILGSFSFIIVPWIAIPGYQRWLMLLVFPFSIYATIGLKRLHLLQKDNHRVLVAILLIFALVGAGYSTGTFSYIGGNSYVPASMVRSSISWDLVDDVVICLEWLNDNAVNDSNLLSEERFYGWTMLYLERADNDVTVSIYGPNSSPLPLLEAALQNGFDDIYLIWFTEQDLEKFETIYTSNEISIFQHV